VRNAEVKKFFSNVLLCWFLEGITFYSSYPSSTLLD